MDPTSYDIADRFWQKVDFTDTCWLWTEGRSKGGYPIFHIPKVGGADRQIVYAHRYAYGFCVGPIPEGLTIDHLCETKLCVLPEHLEPTTLRVNVLRSSRAPAAINARKTHCKRGHEFTEENTSRFKSEAGRLKRHCRTCDRLRARIPAAGGVA